MKVVSSNLITRSNPESATSLAPGFLFLQTGRSGLRIPTMVARKKRIQDSYSRIQKQRAKRKKNSAHRQVLAEQVPYIEEPARVRALPAAPAFGMPLKVATYNVHRWRGRGKNRAMNPEATQAVLKALDADVIALQEALHPFDAPDPAASIAKALGYYMARVVIRAHRHGALCNVILSRWPFKEVFMVDLNFGRLERRSAVVARFSEGDQALSVVSTHMALVDRTRRLQVESILDHPRLQGAVVILGDMNAWRRCRATRELDREFTERHNNRNWPASFPAKHPLLALDRIYARGVQITQLDAYRGAETDVASDHLPVYAQVDWMAA